MSEKAEERAERALMEAAQWGPLQKAVNSQLEMYKNRLRAPVGSAWGAAWEAVESTGDNKAWIELTNLKKLNDGISTRVFEEKLLAELAKDKISGKDYHKLVASWDRSNQITNQIQQHGILCETIFIELESSWKGTLDTLVAASIDAANLQETVRS